MRFSQKRVLKWAVVLLVLALVAGGLQRFLADRQTKKDALAASTAAKAAVAVELVATDVTTAKMLNVTQGLAISGSLKAVNSAVVKARVAGELQALTVREGDFVKAGQIIARIDASELQSRVRQAREQAGSAKAQADVAQRQFDNNKALVDQGFISKTALDTSLANLNAAQSTYKAALAGSDIAKKSVDDTVLKAPISGQVAQRMAQTGERVGVDTRIVEIVDLSRLELEATLSAADSTKIQVGQVAQLQIEGSLKTVAAKVVRVNPTAQAGSRSVLAYLSIDNAAAQPLRQGLFAQGSLGAGQAALLAVPVGSVRTDRPAPYVQAIENSQVVYKTVGLGERGTADGVDVVAITGLKEGAVVLRSNVGSLREGTPVMFTQMGSPAATASAPAAAAPLNAKPAP